MGAEAIDSHLPQGREPGPQTRRIDEGSGSRVSGLLLPVMTVLFIACFIGIPLAVVSVTENQAVIYVTLGLLALVFLVGMWRIARRFRSDPVGHFEVIGEPLELRRGEEIEVELTIHYPEDVDESLRVGLVCVERYDHPLSRVEASETVVERAVGEDIAYETWLPAWCTEERQTFRFRVPPEAPYSHEGECLSVAWRVSAHEPDDKAEDWASHNPIWVLP